MKIRKIAEEFVGYSDKNINKAVYRNPSYKEMNEVGKELRFIAFLNEQEVYVINAINGIHDDIIDTIKKNGKPFNTNFSLFGLASKNGRKWITKKISGRMTKEFYVENDIKEKYSWLSNYRIELLNAKEMKWEENDKKKNDEKWK